MFSRGANYGYFRKVQGVMYFYTSEYDVGEIIRQLSEYNNILKERSALSTLRTEAPVFVPRNGNTTQEVWEVEESNM